MSVQALRKIFWAVIVENKHGLGEETVFDFKYIPDYHLKTGAEELVQTGVRQPGVERRNLKTLLVALGAVGVVTYGSIWVVSGMYRRVFG